MKLAVLAATIAVCGWAASGAAAATGDVAPVVSSNWAGYAAFGTPDTPLTFTSVTATWKQPKATCDGGTPTYSAFWVGLGGYGETSTAVEQIGTESDCDASGRALYAAWYELAPAPSHRINLTIRAGDTITTSVNVAGTDVLVQIKNRTRRTSFTKHLTLQAPDLTSAEWIAEAPSTCGASGRCRVLPLANFTSVSFSRVATIANAHGGTLSDPAWTAQPIQLVPDQGRLFFGTPGSQSTAGALPGAVSADGRGFSVAWQADATSG